MRSDRSDRDLDSKVLEQISQLLNSIDVVRVKNEILVISSGDDQVKLYRVKVDRETGAIDCCQ